MTRYCYICNHCLAIHERAAGGVTFKTLTASGLAECDCGKTAENIIDLDEHATQPDLPMRCAECQNAPTGCDTPTLCRVVQASRRVS